MSRDRRLLAADIGGTNSRFCLFHLRGGTLEKGRKIWLPTQVYPSFAEVLEDMVKEEPDLSPQRMDAVVFAIAGPVEKGRRSTPPNIRWGIDLDALGFPRTTLLINDFAAQAWACVSPVAERRIRIWGPEGEREGVKAVLGAGTGLGKARLVFHERSGWLVLPSEGGHAVFPFVGREEAEFGAYLAGRTGGSPTLDEVLSGRGIEALHTYLTGQTWSARRIGEEAGHDAATWMWFSRFLARACRDFALDSMAGGGVYVAGGIAAKQPHLLTCETFRHEFLNIPSASHAAFLRSVPVSLMPDEDNGLWGAAYFGSLLLVQE